jgi:uncharacterized protein
MHSNVLLIFARTPTPGAVKTRLAKDVGLEKALEAYRELTELTLKVASKVRSCRVVVCYTPADGEGVMRDWLGDGVEYEPQSAGDLGERMASAIRSQLDRGAERVVVVGTDCPGLDRRTIDRAFEALARVDVIAGPATDGGYYLIGVRADHPELFTRIPWSTNQVLARTLAAARDKGLTRDVLDIMWDVDTGVDLLRWKGH